MSIEKVLDVARGEIGTMENPKCSNMTKYGKAYGWNGVPWCVQFLWWCFDAAGERNAFYGGGKTASCGELASWARRNGKCIYQNRVQPGDILLYNFHGGQAPEHCGLVEYLDACYYVTIEGNTSAHGLQTNGGEVMRKHRYAESVVMVIRPDYTEEVKSVEHGRYQTVEECPEWARPTVRRLVDAGHLRGFDWGLNLSEDMLRLLVILERAGAIRAEEV